MKFGRKFYNGNIYDWIITFGWAMLSVIYFIATWNIFEAFIFYLFGSLVSEIYMVRKLKEFELKKLMEELEK